MKNNLKAIVNYVSHLISDWEDTDNGQWLQSFDDCADSKTLADLIAYDNERFNSMLSDNFKGFDDLTDSNKEDFIYHLLEWEEWKAVYCHSFGNWGIQRKENVNLFFGQIGEHEEQIEGIEKYTRLIETRFPDITVSGDCIYYYNDGGIAFELQGDYQEIWQGFIESNNHHNCQYFLSDARGVYIPRDFVEMIDLEKWQGITNEDAEILAFGPEGDLYWETWNDVLDNASIIENGIVWRLYQDGNLWLVTDNYIYDGL